MKPRPRCSHPSSLYRIQHKGIAPPSRPASLPPPSLCHGLVETGPSCCPGNLFSQRVAAPGAIVLPVGPEGDRSGTLPHTSYPAELAGPLLGNFRLSKGQARVSRTAGSTGLEGPQPPPPSSKHSLHPGTEHTWQCLGWSTTVSRLQGRKGLEEERDKAAQAPTPPPLPFWGELALQRGGQVSRIRAHG